MFYVCLSAISLVSCVFISDLTSFYVLAVLMCAVVIFYVLFIYGGVSSLDGFYILDEVSFVLVYITVVVMLVSFFSFNFSNLNVFSGGASFVLLLLASIWVFGSVNIFVLYMFYEASLVPITYVILKWGSYPDRSVSALSILLFTSVFTFPLSVVLVVTWGNTGSFLSLPVSVFDAGLFSWYLVAWVLLSFAVKLPVYGFHYWLPMAHVEAPTFGSMVLAGLLLKLGGCGLMRFMPLFISNFNVLSSGLLGYLGVSICVCAVVCCIQSDFNRLVAYSSVLHMSVVLAIFLISSILSYNVVLILIVFHGVSSPLLFLLVGEVYSSFGTRLIVLLRGVLVIGPLFSFVVVLSFLVNIPVPPLPAFLVEVLSFISLSGVSYVLAAIICVVTLFLVIVYSLSWFQSMVFSSGAASALNSCSLPPLSGLFLLFSLVLISAGFVLFMWLF